MNAPGDVYPTYSVVIALVVVAVGMELDAIAAVVIGGTLPAGGVGYVAGSLLGVLVLGVIQTLISFQGTLSSWWTKIAIGSSLLVFIVLQRTIASRSGSVEKD